MIHVVFNESDIELMKKVIELDESLEGEIIQVRDDFAVGPLAGLDTQEGWQARVDWWKAQLQGSPYTPALAGSFDDRQTVQELKQKLDLDANEQVWIWMAQNQHDVMGYYWLMPQLSEYAGRVMVLYLNNLPFISEKGQLFYPSWLSEIQPKEFLKAKKLARPITPSEFEIDPDEWRKLMEENASVRILEGGKKIAGREENFYDNEILRNISPDWQKATRAITNILHRMKIKTGDVFIMSRIKKLVADGKIEVSGNVEGGWKDFDVRLPGRGVAGQETEEKQEASA
jgi:hypothetical protein